MGGEIQIGKIRKLPTDLANQIAAGEVVERPASVVKELVENALDAGATRVSIAIDHGGLARITVTDDGDGMHLEDARLSLERHATSKIATLDDLANIRSFGFRGEALPSIASVARLVMTTRARGSHEGLEITVNGGAPAEEKPAGAAEGTTIDVRDLFFNVPARRKFLKSTPTESAHVSEVVLSAALARPDVTFHLTRDARLVREHLRAASREERARAALDGDTLYAAQGERGHVRIEAYLGAPERARAGATGLHLFVNDRPVKERALARAVAHAYGSVLEPGRYPIGVVYIDMPYDAVDVNVHPQKAEVRFQDARAIYDAVSRELHAALAKALSLPAMGVPGRPWFARPSSAPVGFTPSGEPTAAWSTIAERVIDRVNSDPASMSASRIEDAHALPLFAEGGFYRGLRFISQMRATFLVCEGDDGLYVLDQHAAAERVTFDALRKAFASRKIASQALLIPEIVELTPREVAIFAEHAESVESLGVDVRAVGDASVAIHAVPKVLSRARPERIVRDLAAELARDAGRAFGGAVDLVLATMACHGSIRAGDAISADEARALLDALDRVDFSGHCPHGRPVITRLGYEELERRVGR